MSSAGIPLDKAELLSIILETLLYGFSLLMFIATIWTLVFRRRTDRVNRKMLAAACLLLLGSTVHLVIGIIRVMEGLILYRTTYPGGPVAFFLRISHWTFTSKSYVFTVQTLIGDSVVLYRCYIVWQSKLVLVLPALLWCASLGTDKVRFETTKIAEDLFEATGIGSPYTGSRVKPNGVFDGSISKWITAFWSCALATNLLTTSLLVARIWYVDWNVRKLFGSRESQLWPLICILIDTGAFYSLTLLVALICFVNGSDGQYVILDMVTPIISIVFYVVFIRVGLANRANLLMNEPLGYTSANGCQNDVERREGMQVQITASTEVDHCVGITRDRSDT